jgi:hypothetical protein
MRTRVSEPIRLPLQTLRVRLQRSDLRLKREHRQHVERRGARKQEQRAEAEATEALLEAQQH